MRCSPPGSAKSRLTAKRRSLPSLPADRPSRFRLELRPLLARVVPPCRNKGSAEDPQRLELIFSASCVVHHASLVLFGSICSCLRNQEYSCASSELRSTFLGLSAIHFFFFHLRLYDLPYSN